MSNLRTTFSPDATANELRRDSAAKPFKPCYGGCGALVKAAFDYCRPCGDMHRQEQQRIAKIERNLRRHQEARA